MKDYLLSDDEEDDNPQINAQQNTRQDKFYFHTQPIREIQQSAQFNSEFVVEPEQQTYAIASQNNIISSYYLKEQSTQQENGDGIDTKNALSNRQSNNPQSTDPQSLSQFDFNMNSNSNSNNNNNNIAQLNENQNIQQANKNRDQGLIQTEKDSLSVKTSSSNKSKLLQQGVIQQQVNQNQQPIQQFQNIKGKRESFLLPSSQFEFQSNIKNGGISQHLLNNQNDNVVNNSYLSNCLKEEEILNQNGENIATNNGFFSRKVSDNLLDDLDQIDQSSKRDQDENENQKKMDTFDQESQVSKASSNIHSRKSSENTSQNIEDLSKSLDYLSQIKITAIQENKQKKFSQDSQNNVRSREFSFKQDLVDQKKDGAKTIKEIEELINKELGSLSQQLGQLQNQSDNNQSEQEIQHPPRSSILSQIARRSRVRGSNIQSEYSVYEVQSSRVEENINNSQYIESENYSSFDSDDQMNGENNNNLKRGAMEKYTANGNLYMNEDIILDENESDEQDMTDSFDNKYIYTRNRSNVYFENKILRSRNSHLDKIHKFQNKNGQLGRKISQIQDDLFQNEQNQNSQSNSNIGESQSNIFNKEEQESHRDYQSELEMQVKISQEEIDQIKQEVIQDIEKLRVNLDKTLIGNGLGKNFKKYSFPLVFKNKDNNLKKRLQEKYKLIQNFQYLLNLDSNIFATDQQLYDQSSKFIYTNNLEYLKMMNKLPENTEELVKKKKKSIEEIQLKYQTRKPSYLQQLEQLKKSNEKKENIFQNDSESNNNNDVFSLKKYLKQNGESLKKNSQQPLYNNLRQRKSVEQIAYNSIEDEIEEDDKHFYDQKDQRGFSLQMYAINKHNYYLQFKEQATDSILQSMFQTMETFSQMLKEEDQMLNKKINRNENNIINNNENENKLRQYSLLQDINSTLNIQSNISSPKKIENSVNQTQVFSRMF
ncbi:hypothetical protein TTHERM_01093570 (macronuclear) [Tetrahymena thermophila SB210]|uniref:Uncharacterized protein n=1 Tax=Tetrahymena thermophila (strain SB210) TaxID=312017 RepID=Q22BN8_TETTS|nr:hypothetical protein TTHERM_01093570 [Tetrahymena thermophila SB210]EAR82691.2 hypothetical protein TTHERM_01093570 [Tetrahymena thermophila SB210]|eukprot:XP_001030354.2 hypothetical protein TTHERM_01093570 [Tetrahymena thermophila SB210]